MRGSQSRGSAHFPSTIMTATQSAYILIAALVVLAGTLAAAQRYLRPFYWRIAFCVIPLVIAGAVVANASIPYASGQAGYKLGLDPLGGTILGYYADRS